MVEAIGLLNRQEVAENMDVSYDLTEAENSRGFFDRVRQLPRDAKEIF